MNALIILGSSRSNGHTKMIVDQLSKKIDADQIDLNSFEFSPYDYQHHNQNDDYFSLVEQMLKYELWIFATPVYWYSMSTVMKKFFDRISDLLRIRKDLGRAFKGKKMALLYCSSDTTDYPFFSKPFELSADYMDMEFVGSVHTWASDFIVEPLVESKLEAFAKDIKSKL